MITTKPRPRIKHIRLRTMKAQNGQKDQEAAKRHQETRQTRNLTPQNGQEARQSNRQSENEDEGQMLIDLLLETYWSV